MTKYKWEFAERGLISGDGMNGFSSVLCGIIFGEYTTFIDSNTEQKKHVIKDLDYKELHKHLKENDVEYIQTHGPYKGDKETQCRWVNINKKFIKKLNKKNLTIIDKDWFK